jgi:hypothetical protein
MKSFFGTLKAECTERQSFAGRQEAKTVIFEYVGSVLQPAAVTFVLRLGFAGTI